MNTLELQHKKQPSISITVEECFEMDIMIELI